MTKEKALEIMNLALQGVEAKIPIEDIEVYDDSESVTIYYNNKALGLKTCLDYHISDILTCSASPVARDWICVPCEICNATKVIHLLGEWKDELLGEKDDD